ncbi:MAG TPA: hypothetical protein PLB67_07395 [Candidatus Hydrogenedentes bacterium]|nr:hypothetical protein [Candidatus Hydrogenedentota bacterium]MDY0030385.1 hypothetical protein [FCB group bacterium]HNZ17494.1 hypothetical protein [Candidatus Hydrogenedentota bacterium]HOH33231.1 hypothetical protein [Candidatus Hydrogenedentota bacterium]HPA04245.1 hypothetical protein [Candidatus Hydrogenedentota bacterium]
MRPDDTRYRVKIDIRVAKGNLEFSLLDLFRDHRKELEDLVKKFEGKDPKELEETIYKGFELDLCPTCQRAYIRAPLRFHPEQGLPDTGIDIDAFLRSLRTHPDDTAEPDA